MSTSPQPDLDPAAAPPSLWAVGSFTVAYLTAALPVALLRGNVEFVMYIAVMAVLIAFVYGLHRNVVLSGGALWCLSFWGLAHMAGGLVLVPAAWPVEADSRVLYSLWLVPSYLKYDQIVHAYGFGVATWVSWQGLRTAIRRNGADVRPSLGLMVIAATAGMGLGSLNEIVEFAATLTIPETNVGGYINTGWDLVANCIGANRRGRFDLDVRALTPGHACPSSYARFPGTCDRRRKSI